MIRSKIGIKLSIETKKKMSEAQKRIGNKPQIMTGKNHPNWKGGITILKYPLRVKIMQSLGYKKWRKYVFIRDNYTCKKCNKRGGELNADHIKRWTDYPKLRLSVGNGQTLCVSCHRKKTSVEMKLINKVK
ncbi:MAG: HNH endonuclease [Bacteroidetes bacterium]|nr:HNH endonuclease [Bacteroidota bacterium]